jgi:hypothetical protein
MKITESKIRQYIRKLLMETFYVQPDGQTLTRQEFEKQNPKLSPDVPDDSPGVVRSLDVKLAMAAKEEFENFDDPYMLDLIKEKGLKLALGDFFDEFLDNLTFTESDIEYVNPDINQYLNMNDEFLNTGLELIGSFMPKTAEYIKHIVAASDQFMAGPDTAQGHSLDPQKKLSFHESFFNVFFSPPDTPGDIGMGKSLTDLVVNKILSAMSNVQSQTPVDFAHQHFAEFEKFVNVVFKNNPIIAANAQALEPYRKGYLDSIFYVLQELFAEINYEFIYYDRGPELKSMKPEDVMVFLPDDVNMVNQTSNALIKYLQTDGDSYGSQLEDYTWMFPDIYRDGSYYRDQIPELRSMPSYYNIKFSVNPKFASNVEAEIDRMFNSRLYDNMMFGIGFRNEGIEVAMYDDDIGEKWGSS